MADLSDVETALLQAVTGILYPAGTEAGSLTGRAVRLVRGWPQASPLNADLRAGVANVSTFPMAGTAENTTRWRPPTTCQQGAATLTVSVQGNAASFAGSGGGGQLAGLLVAGQPFVYRSNTLDTPAVVAAMLAEQVRGSMACWLSGATVTVPGVSQIIARVAAPGTALTEWSRQRQDVRMTAWCPDPGSRDLIGAAITAGLASIAFLTLADGTAGRLRYRGSASVDDDQDARLYRRDLTYSVEYGTTQLLSAPSMLFGDVMINGSVTYA